MRHLLALAFWIFFVGACSLTGLPSADAGPSDVGAPLPADAGDGGRVQVDAGEPDGGGRSDAGSRDGGHDDASVGDAGFEDAGFEDAGFEDAGYDDAGRIDAGPDEGDGGRLDAGLLDAGGQDAGLLDAGGEDAGQFDANHPDSGADDSGMPDANALDANELDAGEADAGPLDAGAPDGGARMADAGPMCPAGLAQCGERCIATDFDPAHCGACDTLCEAGAGASAGCVFGACVSACPAGLTLCGNDCVDTRNSTTHCGGCNRGCEAPVGGFTTCEDGRCESSCLSTDALCEGSCIPVRADPNHCGDCETVCEAPLGGSVACTDFTCQPACPEGETLCGQECVDTAIRVAHCGACDIVCDSDAHCQLGECIRNAPALVGVEPRRVHVQSQSILTLSGERMASPVSVWLKRESVEVKLTEILAKDTNVYVRVPLGLAAGEYAVRVETPSGETLLEDAVEMIADPLRIEVLRAGQGDAQVITSPDGTTMVIDGSIEPVGIQTLRPRLQSPPDYVVVSHYDADHLGGIYALLAGPDLKPNTSDDVTPNIALLDHGDNHSCSSQLCANYLMLRDRLESQGKAISLTPGDRFSLGAGVTATCVLVNGRIAERPRQLTAHENENSVGMYIEFLGFSYLTAGDVTGGPIPGCNAAISGDFVDVETPLARLTGRLDLLKVAHHGSCTATPLAFSALTQPQVGILSMGQNNAFCHPSARVLQNLFHLGTDLYLTNPGVDDDNNASGCPLSVLPPTVAPLFSDVLVKVPGDGTFSVHVGAYDSENTNTNTQGPPPTELDAGAFPADVQLLALDSGPLDAQSDDSSSTTDGGTNSPESSYTKQYSLLRTRPVFQPVEFDNDHAANFEFLGNRHAHPVDAPIRVRSSAGWLQDEGFLLPLAKASADAVDAMEGGQIPADAVALTRSVDNEVLELIPIAPLAPHTQYVLLFPQGTTGFPASEWLHFTTSLLQAPGARYSLAPPPASSSGVLIDVPQIHLDFDRPVFETLSSGTARNLFLEELETGAEIVTGTHSVSEDRMRITLTLPTTARTGPQGESCQSLCPNMTYAVRALGTIVDSQGVPIDTDAVETLSAADCADVSGPELGRADVRTFANAVSISLFMDEPVEGEILLAPSALFEAACAAPSGAECIRIPLSQGACSGDPCAPIGSSCHHFAVSEILANNTDYTWEVQASDRIGKPLSLTANTFSTSTPNATLSLNEVYVDSQQSPESLGEYIEIMNVSSTAINLCEYRIGKTLNPTALKPLCSEAQAEAWLGPFEAALVTGNNFCAVKDSACSPEFDFPPATQIFRQSTASLLGGLSNGSPPELHLVNADEEVVSHIFGAPVCEEGYAVQRVSVYGPDDPSVFVCAPASPGRLEE